MTAAFIVWVVLLVLCWLLHDTHPKLSDDLSALVTSFLFIVPVALIAALIVWLV